MYELSNLLLFILLVTTILLVAVIRSKTGFGILSKINRAEKSPWKLHEFLLLNPNRKRRGEYYRFNEEIVRSHAHKYLGRFDTAILHWEESPVLDLIIERKFPIYKLPEKKREEDIFQAGLYAFALLESGVSCRDSKLAIIYCLQDVAKRCLDKKTQSKCWSCSEGKKFIKNFNKQEIEKNLKRLNEVWYLNRKPKASPSISKCGSCPYSKNGICNYSVH